VIRFGLMACLLTISVPLAASPASVCPAQTACVDVEWGPHRNPPGLLRPEVYRDRLTWASFNEIRPASRMWVTCYDGRGKATRVALPLKTNRCDWRFGKMICA
jgi:hypothetical protein